MFFIVEKRDRIGFYFMEVWGGVIFDVCICYLREDFWERFCILREYLKKMKL